MIHLLTLLLIILTVSLEKNYISWNRQNFINFKPNYFNKKIKNNLHTIWIYNSFRNNSPLIQICIDLIFRYNKKKFNIQLINDQNINYYIPNLYSNIDKISYYLKIQYIKYYLLYNYGGIWIEPDTLLFKNLNIICEKLIYYDFITFGCNYNNLSFINDSVIAFNKKSITAKSILEILQKHITNFNHTSFNINNNIQLLLKKSNKSYHFDSSYDGSIDYRNKPIRIDNFISHNYTLLSNQKNLIFINLNINRKSFPNKYKWLLKLNKNQLIESNMWISKLIRYSLNISQKYYTDYYHKYDESMRRHKINLVPDNYYEYRYNIYNSNITPYSSYLLIDKESIRNT